MDHGLYNLLALKNLDNNQANDMLKINQLVLFPCLNPIVKPKGT